MALMGDRRRIGPERRPSCLLELWGNGVCVLTQRAVMEMDWDGPDDGDGGLFLRLRVTDGLPASVYVDRFRAPGVGVTAPHPIAGGGQRIKRGEEVSVTLPVVFNDRSSSEGVS